MHLANKHGLEGMGGFQLKQQAIHDILCQIHCKQKEEMLKYLICKRQVMKPCKTGSIQGFSNGFDTQLTRCRHCCLQLTGSSKTRPRD